MELFNLEAQVCGEQRTANATSDGFSGVVYCSGVPHIVRSQRDAVRVAADHIGEFLAKARKPGVPWGLKVEVQEVAAVYGEWPLLPGRPSGRPDDSPVTRIRKRFRGNDPHRALDNAIEVVKAYLPQMRKAA